MACLVDAMGAYSMPNIIIAAKYHCDPVATEALRPVPTKRVGNFELCETQKQLYPVPFSAQPTILSYLYLAATVATEGTTPYQGFGSLMLS